jgi:uncharacterized protein (DUF433 family)
VATIQALLRDGASNDEILQEYPRLTSDDIAEARRGLQETPIRLVG